jgi:hypothetical protein
LLSVRRISEFSYRLLIHNGGLDARQPAVSAGFVLLNGEQIAGPSDLDGLASVIEKPVSLAADNSLVVILLGASDAVMTIEIRGDDEEIELVALAALSPTSPDGEPARVFNSGWPLTLRLSLSLDPGLSVLGQWAAEIGPYPRKDEWGFAVWEDPDGCLSWIDHEGNLDQPECEELQSMGPLPLDELLLQFRPSAHTAGEPGASPDLPALVVLADTGLGWDDDGPVSVALNLAGLFNTVAYELNDATRRTSILAKLVVPFGLFAPILDEDLCVGDPVTCGGDFLFRVRGFDGETFSVTPGPNVARCFIYERIFEERVVTLRAFVVKLPPPLVPSEAPQGISLLEDVDGDGLVDSADAVLSGFELLSEELVVPFRQIYGAPLTAPGFQFDTRFIRSMDLDGNGRVDGELEDCLEFQSSPVKIVKVPR